MEPEDQLVHLVQLVLEELMAQPEKQEPQVLLEPLDEVELEDSREQWDDMVSLEMLEHVEELEMLDQQDQPDKQDHKEQPVPQDQMDQLENQDQEDLPETKDK